MLAAGRAPGQAVITDRAQEAGMRRNVFGLGFAGGPASGLGISFRHHLPSTISYQLIGGVIKATDKLHYSIGTEIQFDLNRTTDLRFYAAGGLSYFFAGVEGHNEMKGPGRIGLGVGVETGLRGSGFNISGDLLFTYFTDGTVLPLPQLAIHYYFY